MKKKISFQIKWKALEGARAGKARIYILGDEYEWMAGFHQSTCNAHPSKIVLFKFKVIRVLPFKFEFEFV